MIGIYTIKNLINGKQYVGQSINIQKRWSQHKSDYIHNENKKILYKAMRKYGIENFSFEVLEECPIDKLDEKEIFWIKELNTLNPNGYNISQGGTGNSSLQNNYEELAKAYLIHHNSKKVAEIYNCDFKTVLNACHTMGVPLNNTKERAVIQIDINTNKEIAYYSNIHEAYRAMNKKYDSSISRVCRGIRKTAYGYKWKYAPIV